MKNGLITTKLNNFLSKNYCLNMHHIYQNTMKRIVKFGKRKFICELKKVVVRGSKTTDKVFCKEIKKKIINKEKEGFKY